MNTLLRSLATFFVLMAACSTARAAVLNIPSLGADSPGTLGGWYADDMRSDGTGGVAGSTNLIGINRTINTASYGAVYTNQPAAGIALHDEAIDNQVIFGNAPGAAPGFQGAVNLRSNNPSNTFNTKSQIAAVIDGTVGTGSGSSGGFAQGSVLNSGLDIEYSWYGVAGSTSTITPALKFGIKTSDFASTGLSTRTGENAWDKVLIYEPNVNGKTANGTWQTETIDFSNGLWWFFDRTAPTGGTLGTPLTLSAMSSDATIYATGKSIASAFAKMTSPDAVITSVQLGIGSTATAGNVFVNQLMVDFLNGGDLITFGTEPPAAPVVLVPEPASVLLLALGSLVLIPRRCHRA